MRFPEYKSKVVPKKKYARTGFGSDILPFSIPSSRLSNNLASGRLSTERLCLWPSLQQPSIGPSLSELSLGPS